MASGADHGSPRPGRAAMPASTALVNRCLQVRHRVPGGNTDGLADVVSAQASGVARRPRLCRALTRLVLSRP